jgi:hypothetical protein
MDKYLVRVLLAGGVGGAVGWIYGETLGQGLGLSPLWAIPASIVLGSGAVLIGLLLANNDRTDLTRAVAFAFACGVFWQPLYEAGKAYVERLPEIKKEAKAAEAAEVLDTELVGLAAGPVAGPKAVVEVGQATTALIAAASRVNDPELRADYERRVSRAVETIAHAQVPAEQKVEVLADVSRLAAEKGQTTVAVDAVRVKRLTERSGWRSRWLARRATRQPLPAVWPEIFEAVHSI